MEIKIDTSRDSKEDIRKIVKFLQQILEEGYSESGSQPSLPSGDNVMGGIFDFGPDTSSPQSTNTNPSSPSSDSSSTVTLAQMFAADNAAAKQEQTQQASAQSTGLFLDLGGKKFIPLEEAEGQKQEPKPKKKFNIEEFEKY